MRKLLLALLLPMALLLAQQGAVSHEIGHVAAELRSQGKSPHSPGDLQCEACLGFAHLASLATSQAVAPVLVGLGFHFAVIERPAFVAADAPLARSRGPPLFL